MGLRRYFNVALKSDLKFLFNAQEAEFLGDQQQDAISAAGNNSQANATQLTGTICAVTVVTAGANSIKLPLISTFKGSYVFVANEDAADTINCFPAVGDAIGTLGANNAMGIASLVRALFFKISSTRWLVITV